MKFHLKNTTQGLIPMYDEDYEEKRKLKIGGIYMAEIKKPRNYEFHKKYFALIACAWEYLNEKQVAFFRNNKEYFRKSMEISAGNCDPIFNVTKKEWNDVPRSIAFDKMNEDEFSDLYNRVKDVLFVSVLKNISEEEFNSNLINF